MKKKTRIKSRNKIKINKIKIISQNGLKTEYSREQVVEALRAAKEIIITPDKWGKGDYALDHEGHETLGWVQDKSEIKCACSIGATRVGINDSNLRNVALIELTKTLNATFGYSGSLSLHKYNDLPETTHQDIMNLYDRTIERLENA